MPAGKKSTKKTQKTAKPKPMSAISKIARKLDDGIKRKSSRYTFDISFISPSAPIFYTDIVVSDIPKYRNDPTASTRQANLDIARTSDKLFIKDISIHCSANNSSTVAGNLRLLFFRNSGQDEVPSGIGGNWFMDASGSPLAASIFAYNLPSQRYNYDLVKYKSDLFLDKQMTFGPDTSTEGNNLGHRNWYKKINQVALYESKGDSSSADDLKTGKYCLAVAHANTSGTYHGELDVRLTIVVNYCEA